MGRHWRQDLTWIGLLLWLIAFGTFSRRLLRVSGSLRDLADAGNQVLLDSNVRSMELQSHVAALRRDAEEMAFLQSLVDVLPQEKGFLRTQRAISEEVETLRARIDRRLPTALHILVDTRANKLYVKNGLTLLWKADCSVGRGGILRDKKTGRRWEFVTPHGQFEVLDKIENPVWTKPDWAFVESGEPVPPPTDDKRHAVGELGSYVLNLGDGYLIHGTKTEAQLGRPASHGCVRLGATDLKNLYQTVPLGTRVYIY